MSNEPIDLIPVIVERENAVLPDWCDSWGFKSVQPDLRTYGGYQWPCPGQTATCDPDRLVPENTDACPSQEGDGLCVATSWWGMASGGIPARALLLVAYSSAEVLGWDDAAGKLRLPRVAVVALVDGQRLLREAGSGANLRVANLTGANLYHADLYHADLYGAYLYGANLYHADLYGARLTGAYLTGADLTGARLTGANLTGARLTDADLRGANLTRAYLTGANLHRANLTGARLDGANLAFANLSSARLTGAYLTRAYLTGANLTGADLRGANLYGADLRGANLYGARHDDTTTWPDGYKPVTA